MDLTFQEKSLIGTLTATLLLFGYYFTEVFQVITEYSLESLARLPFLMIGVILVFVAVEAIYHIVIALHSKPEGTDERDKEIERRAARISYFVLFCGCFLTMGHVLLNMFIDYGAQEPTLTTPVMTVNLILLSVVLAEVTGFSLQLYYYRRGV